MAAPRFTLLPSLVEASFPPDLDVMRNRLRQFLGEPMVRPLLEPTDFRAEPVGWTPAVELSETPEEFTLIAELPGIKPADVAVEYTEGTLTIRGSREEEKKSEDGKRRMHLYERSYGAFLRSFAFPRPVNGEKVVADFKDGMLTVHVPKVEEVKASVKKVDIKVK